MYYAVLSAWCMNAAPPSNLPVLHSCINHCVGASWQHINMKSWGHHANLKGLRTCYTLLSATDRLWESYVGWILVCLNYNWGGKVEIICTIGGYDEIICTMIGRIVALTIISIVIVVRCTTSLWRSFSVILSDFKKIIPFWWKYCKMKRWMDKKMTMFFFTLMYKYAVCNVNKCVTRCKKDIHLL